MSLVSDRLVSLPRYDLSLCPLHCAKHVPLSCAIGSIAGLSSFSYQADIMTRCNPGGAKKLTTMEKAVQVSEETAFEKECRFKAKFAQVEAKLPARWQTSDLSISDRVTSI